MLLALTALAILALLGVVYSLLNDDSSSPSHDSTVRPPSPETSAPSALPVGRDSGANASQTEPTQLQAPASTGTTAAAHGTISGIAVDTRGDPIANVEVFLLAGSQAVQSFLRSTQICSSSSAGDPYPDPDRGKRLAAQSVTSSDGLFVVSPTPLQTLAKGGLLALRSLRHRPSFIDIPATRSNDQLRLGQLVMESGALTTGRLLGADGAPVEGARVEYLLDEFTRQAVARGGASRRTAMESSLVTKSCADGSFQLLLPQGRLANLRIDHELWTPLEIRDLETKSQELDLGELRMERGGEILGLLVNDRQEPLPARWVYVELSEPSAPARQGRALLSPRQRSVVSTDEMGAFHFTGLGEGWVSLHARGERTAWARLPQVQIGNREVLLVAPEASVRIVTVRDSSSGDPIPSVNLSVSPPAEAPTWPSDEAQFRVSSGKAAGLEPGQHRVDGLDVDGARVHLTAEGYEQRTVDVEGSAPGTLRELDVLLAKQLSISGRVIQPDGQPVAEVLVQANSPLGTGQRAESDASGSFTLTGLSEGTWQVWPTSDDHLGIGHFTLPLRGTSVENLLIILVPTATLTGTVKSVKSEAIPAGKVEALLVEERWTASLKRYGDGAAASKKSKDFLSTAFGSAVTDEAAEYELTGLAPGDYLVTAVPTGTSSARSTLVAARESDELPDGVVAVSVTAGDTKSINLRLPSPATLSGRITVAGRGAAEASIALMSWSQGRWISLAQTLSDEDGRYRLENLPHGKATLVAFAKSVPVPALVGVELDSHGASKDVNLTGATLHVSLVDDATGQPATGARIALGGQPEVPPQTVNDGDLRMLFRAFWATAQTAFRQEVDGRGELELMHIAPGSYTVTASGERWLPSSGVPVLVETGAQPEPVVIRLRAGAAVRGQVEGEPVAPGGRLVAELLNPEGVGIVKWANVDNGSFLIEGLSAGSYRLQIRDLSSGGGVRKETDIQLAAGRSEELHLRLD